MIPTKQINVLFLGLLLLVGHFAGFSQINTDSFDGKNTGIDTSQTAQTKIEKAALFTPKKISSGVQFGTSFTTFGSYGSSFNTFVTPYISYPLSKRFSISGGLTLSNTTAFGLKPWYSSGEVAGYNGNFGSALLFVSGNYLVNDRLTISGTVYKQFNLFNTNPTTYPFTKNEFQGGYMKVDYKVFDNFHIEAGFGYSQGYDPYNPFQSMNPYHSYGFPGSPTPFGR